MMLQASPGGLVVADVTGAAGGLGCALTEALAREGWRTENLRHTRDLSEEQNVDDALDNVLAGMGTPAGMILLADTSAKDVSLTGGCTAAWHAALTSPLRAAFLVARRVVDEFMAGGEGGRLLVFVRCPREPATIPASLCEALVCLARAIAIEYGRRSITCNAVIVPQDGEAAAEAAVQTACFLLSPDAGYINGEVLDLRPTAPA